MPNLHQVVHCNPHTNKWMLERAEDKRFIILRCESCKVTGGIECNSHKLMSPPADAVGDVSTARAAALEAGEAVFGGDFHDLDDD